MNLTTGVFTVPEDGIYFFSIIGIRTSNNELLLIFIRLNEKHFGLVASSIRYGTFALHSILNLTKGDQIDLFLNQGASYGTHFTGVLLTSSQKIADIDVQSLPVHFYVQRNSSFLKIGSIIPFELTIINVGSAMDISSGIFTAPTDGIYRFSFFGAKYSANQSTLIKLRLNQEMIGSAYATEKIEFCPFYIEVILQLKLGDRVDLFLEEGNCYEVMNVHLTHFTGSRLLGKLANGSPSNVASPISFYVQRNSSYSISMTTIPFEMTRLNEGGAMNVETGVFKAPEKGMYRFSLFGIKDESNKMMTISLRKNGIQVTANDAYGTPYDKLVTYGLQSVLLLHQGDEIDLYLLEGALFDKEDRHVTHFIGYLIE